MITRAEILMGRDKQYPLTPELEQNLRRLLLALNVVRRIYGKPMIVTSGYRPGHYNKQANGAPNSAHAVCLACDFRDTTEELDQFCSNNQDLLEALGLWQEAPSATPGWCHLDLKPRPPRAAGQPSRTFNP